VLELEKEPWMEPYIRTNTEFRKQAKSDFETNFYKLMINSVFGKTMENLRNRVDVKIVRAWEANKIRKLVLDPSYDRFKVFSNNLAGIHMHKRRLVLNKPVYTGMTMLENSKLLMYDFYYNHLKARYGPRCDLIYIDTDSHGCTTQATTPKTTRFTMLETKRSRQDERRVRWRADR